MKARRRLLLIMMPVLMLWACKSFDGGVVSVHPDPLQVHGDSIAFKADVKVPTGKKLKEGQTYSFQPEIGNYKMKKVEVSADDFPHEDRDEIIKTVHVKVPYVKDEMQNKPLVFDQEYTTRKGKVKDLSDLENVSRCCITTSELIMVDTEFMLTNREQLEPKPVKLVGQFNFPLNKSNLDENELTDEDVDRIKQFILSGKEEGQPNHINIQGYASPEGPMERNRQLASQRAHVVKTLLESRLTEDEEFTFDENNVKFNVGTTAEDWKGFAKKVDMADEVDNKDQLIEAATSETDPQIQEDILLNATNGNVRNVEPQLAPLRRTTLVIEKGDLLKRSMIEADSANLVFIKGNLTEDQLKTEVFEEGQWLEMAQPANAQAGEKSLMVTYYDGVDDTYQAYNDMGIITLIQNKDQQYVTDKYLCGTDEGDIEKLKVRRAGFMEDVREMVSDNKQERDVEEHIRKRNQEELPSDKIETEIRYPDPEKVESDAWKRIDADIPIDFNETGLLVKIKDEHLITPDGAEVKLETAEYEFISETTGEMFKAKVDDSEVKAVNGDDDGMLAEGNYRLKLKDSDDFTIDGEDYWVKKEDLDELKVKMDNFKLKTEDGDELKLETGEYELKTEDGDELKMKWAGGKMKIDGDEFKVKDGDYKLKLDGNEMTIRTKDFKYKQEEDELTIKTDQEKLKREDDEFEYENKSGVEVDAEEDEFDYENDEVEIELEDDELTIKTKDEKVKIKEDEIKGKGKDYDFKFEEVDGAPFVKTYLSEYDEALKYFKQAYQINDQSCAVMCNIGAVYTAKCDYAEARHFLTKSIEEKETPQAHYNLGIVHALEGNYSAALKHLDKAGDNPKILYNRGLVKLLQGNVVGAEEDMNKFTQHFPDVAESYYVLAIIGARTDDRPMLQENLAKACKLSDKLCERAEDDLEFRDFEDVVEKDYEERSF